MKSQRSATVMSMCAFGILIASFAVGLPVSGLGNSTGTGSVDSGKDVTVVNSDAQSVPVRVVAAPSTPGNVIVTNTPGVSVVSMPAVEVRKLPDAVLRMRDEDRPASQPWQVSVTISINAGDPGASAPIPQIPIGKRLVLEYVGASITSEAADRTFLTLGVRNPSNPDPVPVRIPLQASPQAVAGFVEWIGSSMLRAYVDSGSVGLTRSGSTNWAGGSVTLSGHLVDVP